MRFAGANADVAVQGLDAMTARANFLIGDDPAAWHTGLPTYRGIVYRNLYPGIDMSYTANDPKLKSEFHVAPGADPALIRLEYPDADRVFVDAHGDLVVRMGTGRAPRSCANKRPWRTRNLTACGIPSKPATASYTARPSHSIWPHTTSPGHWSSIR